MIITKLNKLWCRVIWIVLTAVTGIGQGYALERGHFRAYEINPATGINIYSLAVIDASQESRDWLRENYSYLLEHQIPLIVLDATENDLAALRSDFVGLLSGLAPEPSEYLEELLQHIGVNLYPVVIENGIVWQEKQ